MISGGAFAQNVFFSDVQFESGTDNNKASLEISVDAGEQYAAGLELVITFPEGISVEKGKRGYVSTIEDIADGFSATINLRENGDFYVAVTNNNNWEFLATAGKVITLSLVKDANLGDGVYTANVHDIILCTAADENFQVSQINDVTEATFNIAVGEVAADVYTVAGAFKVGNEEQPSFFGQMWAPELTTNDMVKGEDGIYTLSFSDVALEAGTILYKVVKNHSWDVNWGFNGNNADYIVNEANTYNITFKFNPDELLSNGFNLTCELDGTVGIRDIRANGEDGKIYNTAGQRVVKAGKGLYIQNGKKVVKK